MKVSRSREEEINIIKIIEDLEKEHGTVYWETIDNITYVYKPCGRRDFNEIMNEEIEASDKEDEVIKRTLLYPVPDEDFFDKIKAGIFKRLIDVILESSHFRQQDLMLRVQITNSFRAEMFDMQNQITCLIHEAFPEYDIEDIENWGIEKTAKFLSRSEWILKNLRGMNIDESMAEAAMAGDVDKYNEIINKEEEEIKKEVPVTKKASLTPDKLAELRAKYPEIDWGNDSVANDGEAALNDNFKVSPATETLGYK